MTPISPEKMIDNNTLLSQKEKKDLRSVVRNNPELTQIQAIAALEQNYNIKNIINTIKPENMNREQVAMVQLYANLLGEKIAIDGIHGPKTKGALDRIYGIVNRKDVALPKTLPKPTIEATNILKNFPSQGEFEKLTIHQKGVVCVKFLMSQGIKKHVASGIVGNLYVESGGTFNTTARGDRGKAFGLAQWHPDRQKNLASFAASQGLEKHDYKAQLGFVVKELPANGGATIKKAVDAEQAAKLFCTHFERPGKPHMSGRTTFAKKIDNMVA